MLWIFAKGSIEKKKKNKPLYLCTSQFQNRSSPPGQFPDIWPALSSVQWGIWPKMTPTRWGIWLSCQNVCQWKQKDFAILWYSKWATFTGHCSCRFHIGFPIVLLLSFYIVISWNMPLFKARSEEKLNKKFIMVEKFVCIKGQANCWCFKLFTVSGNTRNDQSPFF